MLRCKKILIAVLFTGGCLGTATTTPTPTEPTTPPLPTNPSNPTEPTAPEPTSTLGIAVADTSGGEMNTFDHEKEEIDPFIVLARIQEVGPPEVSTRMHSCQKVKYSTLRNLLTGVGVNIGRTDTPASAGQLFTGGAQAMGAPNYAARISESIELTAAGASKLFDIFMRAAEEVITQMPMTAACNKAGTPTQMFDAMGKCTLDGISCLIGAPASQAQKDLCDEALTQGSTPDIGKQIAVAALLAAAHTCE